MIVVASGGTSDIPIGSLLRTQSELVYVSICNM